MKPVPVNAANSEFSRPGRTLRLLLLLAIMFSASATGFAQEEEGSASPSEPGRISITFNATPLNRILTFLETQGHKVLLRGKVPEATPISFGAKNDDIETVLSKIVGPRDWVWYKNPESGYYEIWDKQSYEQEVLPTLMIDKTFTLEYINVEDIVPALQPLINQDKGASISVDERLNKVFVRDLPEVVQQIARLLEELDVNLVTRVFRIKHADTEEIADKLAVYKSTPGTIDPDPRTHQIVVTDIEQNIKRMELLVDVLDVGPEMRIYDLNNIGFEGVDIDLILEAVEQVVTEGAFVQANFNAGTLLVEDVPEVHDRIEQVLAAFDPPQKQILLEAEIIETNYNKEFNYSLDVTFSEDLFAAQEDGFVNVLPEGADLEFINFRDQFPVVNLGAGLSLVNLSTRARIDLAAALRDTESQVLLQPRLLVKNQELATIEVGQELPFANTLPSTGDSDRLFTTIQTVGTGLLLELRPSISNNGLVEIELFFRNNEGDPVQIQSQGTANTAIQTSTQEIETVLIIPSGETRMIGGLLRNSRSRERQGLPLISRIPIIGDYLFGSLGDDDAQRHIMVFITPTIIEERPQRGEVYSRPFSFEEVRAIQTGQEPEYEYEGPRGTKASDYRKPPSDKEEATEEPREDEIRDVFDLDELAESPGEEAPTDEETEGEAETEAEVEPETGVEMQPDEEAAPPDEYEDIFGQLGQADWLEERLQERTDDEGIEGQAAVPPVGEVEEKLEKQGPPGQPAEHLLVPGSLREDQTMRDTLTESEMEIQVPMPPTSYSTRLRGPGSSGGGGTAGAQPAGGKPAAPGGKAPAQRPGQGARPSPGQQQPAGPVGTPTRRVDDKPTEEGIKEAPNDEKRETQFQ